MTVSTPNIHAPDKISTLGHFVSPGDVFLEARQFREANEVVPVTEDHKDDDREVIRLVLIDCQQDFTCAGGVRYEPGNGIENAAENICQFIYQNVGTISSITPINSNHFPFQIMFPAFWENEKGENPEPGTRIDGDDLNNERWKPVEEVADWLSKGDPDWLSKQVLHYVDELEKKDRQLIIKPEHCIHGTQGQAFNGCIDAARLFHGYVRNVQPEVELIDAHPLVESLSVFGPLIQTRHDGVEPIAWRNVPILRSFLRCDRLLVAGFNRVRNTVVELAEILEDDPAFGKVHVLTDCVTEDLPSVIKVNRRLSTRPLNDWDDEDDG